MSVFLINIAVYERFPLFAGKHIFVYETLFDVLIGCMKYHLIFVNYDFY